MLIDIRLEARYGFFNLTTEYHRHVELMRVFMRSLENALWSGAAIKSATLVLRNARIPIAPTFAEFQKRLSNGVEFSAALGWLVRELHAIETDHHIQGVPSTWQPLGNMTEAGTNAGI